MSMMENDNLKYVIRYSKIVLPSSTKALFYSDSFSRYRFAVRLPKLCSIRTAFHVTVLPSVYQSFVLFGQLFTLPFCRPSTKALFYSDSFSRYRFAVRLPKLCSIRTAFHVTVLPSVYQSFVLFGQLFTLPFCRPSTKALFYSDSFSRYRFAVRLAKLCSIRTAFHVTVLPSV
ncbi:hypothetical protein ACQ4LE_000981 [Meloidogyne hapla]